MSAVAADPGRP